MGSALEIQSPTGARRVTAAQLERLARSGQVRVGDLLAEERGATHVTFEAADGDYRASIPIDVVRRRGVIVLDGAGSPRLRVEDGDTLCWNVKDLARIRPTVGEEADSVPADPPH